MSHLIRTTNVRENQVIRWRKWLADFKMFLVASNITNKARQRALLLYQGHDYEKYLDNFPTQVQTDVAEAEELLTAYFEP